MISFDQYTTRKSNSPKVPHRSTQRFSNGKWSKNSRGKKSNISAHSLSIPARAVKKLRSSFLFSANTSPITVICQCRLTSPRPSIACWSIAMRTNCTWKIIRIETISSSKNGHSLINVNFLLFLIRIQVVRISQSVRWVFIDIVCSDVYVTYE